MQKVYISKDAKVVLRHVASGGGASVPYGLTEHRLRIACNELELLDLLQVCRQEGGGIYALRLTDSGRSYISHNPMLHNPINYKLLTFIVSVCSLVATITIAVLACTRLL